MGIWSVEGEEYNLIWGLNDMSEKINVELKSLYETSYETSQID